MNELEIKKEALRIEAIELIKAIIKNNSDKGIIYIPKGSQFTLDGGDVVEEISVDGVSLKDSQLEIWEIPFDQLTTDDLVYIHQFLIEELL